MEFQFRQIEEKDKTKVLELLKEAAEKISKMKIDHWQYWKNPPKEKIEWVEEGIRNNEFFFINEQSGENIGMVRILNDDLLYWGEQKEKAKYIHSLVIKEKYNGKGLGTKILQEIERNAKNDDCNYLRLDADSKNPKLCRYYENLGFKKIGMKEFPLSSYNLYEKKI
ncbi:GNAT family N-acetyltransferase [Carboxylicivirga sp. A043]|uniref:GNAT family N-acetyltransferase n=1 Tax=Carboxylicivirga litoralis TaxID=2816963 RepID=UPI0021CB4988|nr:GNAT family N-acetyltransferase [Carboxylicivirga sp. A043]MCU4156601.1 GNAT family N-acetyltransferase [Carboxylicivirga sp. A043]